MPPRLKPKCSLKNVRDYRKLRKKQLIQDHDERKKERRMFEAARARDKRSKQSPIETAARRWRDAQRARERRAKMTPEQLKALREKDAILKRRRRLMETEEQRALRRSLEAQKARDRRASMPSTATVKKMGMQHFMDLAERMDVGLEGSVPDPLGLPADENIEWIKREVDLVEDQFSTISEMCIAALASIPVKSKAGERGNKTAQPKLVCSVANDPSPETIGRECVQTPSAQPDGGTEPTNSTGADGKTGRPRITLKLNVSSGDSECTDSTSNSSSDEDSGSGAGVEKKNSSDPILKIIQVESLIQENSDQLPRFGADQNLNKPVCGEMGNNLNNQESEDDGEFTRWEEEQKAKESCNNRQPNNSAFQCDICNKFLSSRGNMRLHKMKRHKVKTPFCCKVCGSEFDFRRELVQHRNKVHRNKEGLFECQCGKTTYEFHNFLTHLTVHQKSTEDEELEEGSEQTLEDLNSVDSSSTGLKSGKTINNRNEFICEHCGKTFKRPDSLKTHLNLIHMEDGGEMAERIKNSKQEKNFVCDSCGRRFGFQCLLRDHLNLHNGVKPYICPECNRAFCQKSSLKQHVKAHNAERRFRCLECPAAFFSRGDLTKHIRKHTGERPYICEVCGEGYAQSSHLNVHKRSHSGERPFSCDFCGRGFTKSSDVARHRRIHTGELPFLCQVCGKGFRQSAQCQNHIKNHHPETVLN